MEKEYPFIENISIDKLKLDMQNPRLPKSKQGKDESTVIEYLVSEAATEELMIAIGENNFFCRRSAIGYKGIGWKLYCYRR